MQKKMKDDIAGILLSQEQIERRVAELAAQIQKDYAGKELIMVCVLNGAAVFYIDLLMELDIPLEMNFIRVSSYGSGTKSSGSIRLLYDLEADIPHAAAIGLPSRVHSPFVRCSASTVRCSLKAS